MRRALVLVPVLAAAVVPVPDAGAAKPPVPRATATVVVTPLKGTVKLVPRGSKAIVRLRSAKLVKIGSTVDVTKGRVRIQGATGSRGKLVTAVVSAGAFTLVQRPADKGVVELRMVGGGISCAEPHGAAGAQRLLRVSTSGGFASRGCFAYVRTIPAPAKGSSARARAAQAGTTGGTVTWAVWEYPTGWRIESDGTSWLKVTDLVTNTTQKVHQTFLYKYIYETRAPLPTNTPASDPVPTSPTTPANATLDPLGDLLPCGFVTCTDVDLRAASLTVSGGSATFHVEGYSDFPDPPTLDFQIWKAAPGTGTGLLDGDFHVHPCKGAGYPCAPGTVSVFDMATPANAVKDVGSWTKPTPATVDVTWPVSAIGSPSDFWWAAGSETCGWRDKIPDTGGLHYPVVANGARVPRGPVARMAC